ncbi:MAG: hypothetical protein KF729_25775 [Sandaracinaceae bacterium]|nr:hypothetical protein [Sandaracinaceae bacterium]
MSMICVRLPGLTGTLRRSTADWSSPDAVHAALEASFDGHTFPFER